MIEDQTLHVRTAVGAPEIWRVEYSVGEPWRLSLVDPDESRLDATGNDLYDCLKQIRRQTDPVGILLCCNGARKNVRPSGFLSSSLGAISVYKIHRWRASMPWDLVDLFAYAPPRQIATLEEQAAYLQKVDEYRKSALSLLNPVHWITYGLRELYEWIHGARMRRRMTKVDRM